ncbi:hypothetical protein HaLaN_25296, partial [Haematococcus lacustris]
MRLFACLPAAAVRSPGPGAGEVLQEVGEGDGGGGHEAPWACQAVGGPGAQTSGGAGWCLWMSTAPAGQAQQPGTTARQLEKEMAEVAMKRHGRAKQLVVFFGA